MPDTPSDTTLVRAVRHAAKAEHGRLVENVGFWLALIVGVVYVALVEIVPVAIRYYVALNFTKERFAEVSGCLDISHPSFPWGMVIMIVTFALPKIVGRATTGKVWEGIAAKFGGA